MLTCGVPFLGNRWKGEKKAKYNYYTSRLPEVQNLAFCLIGRKTLTD